MVLAAPCGKLIRKGDSCGGRDMATAKRCGVNYREIKSLTSVSI